MRGAIIAAIGENRAIGKDNDLIWSLPADMRFFRNTTMGHYVIMGRKNWESIPHNFRPLKGRQNIVVTRQSDYPAKDAEVVNSIEEGLAIARDAGDDEPFIIGGGKIYQLALDNDLVSHMYITHIHGSFDADVFFPAVDYSSWKKEVIFTQDVDDKHDYSFEVVKYSRPA